MQEFFMDYGLWLLIGLLVIIALVFLLSGKRKADEPIEPSATPEPVAPIAPPTPYVDPIIAAPVAASPVVVEPVVPVAPVEPVPPIVPIEPIAPPVPVAPAPIAQTPIAPTPVAEPVAAPAPIPTSPAVAAVADDSDDLLRLKGVGPKLKALLIDLGVTRYAQIAAWSDADIAAIDGKLGSFKGRPVRDQWVDQAKYLAAGDIAGFEAKYGKL
jgi:predicted flap endonuclease-1-like 5' DNA nuclease